MKTPVTSVYCAPANMLTNYDFVIGQELPNTNIIIYSAKKRAGTSKGFLMRQLKKMRANGSGQNTASVYIYIYKLRSV